MQQQTIDHHIERILTQLKKLQHKDGSWSANNFINALVTYSLSVIRGTIHNKSFEKELIRMTEKSATHILEQRSTAWSWNYYPAQEHTKSPYPDDLDDTFCSLIALSKIKTDSIHEQALIHIAQLLSITQIKDGGPYRTWITGTHPDYADVDPAVNANIAYFLSLKDIELPNLSRYIDGIITTKKYTSLYYDNPLFIIYFIARGYRGKYRGKLIQDTLELLHATRNRTYHSLGICALLRLGVPTVQIKTLMNKARIRKQKTQDRNTKGNPLYIEKISNGHIVHAQSRVFDLAIQGEMYSLLKNSKYHELKIKMQRHKQLVAEKILQNITHRVTTRINQLSSRTAARARKIILTTLSSTSGNMMTLLPFNIMWHTKHRTVHNKLNPGESRVAVLCGMISLYGWMTYTIHDEITDDQCHHNALPIATIFHAEMLELISDICRRRTDLQKLMQVYLDTFNSAIHDDTTRSAQIRGVSIPSRSATINKSLGLMIPALLTFQKINHDKGDISTKHFIVFFRNFIFLRQMSDDIHDWREDLEGGIITRVTARLIASDINSSELPEQAFTAARTEMTTALRKSIHVLQALQNSHTFDDVSFLEEMLYPFRKILDI